MELLNTYYKEAHSLTIGVIFVDKILSGVITIKLVNGDVHNTVINRTFVSQTVDYFIDNLLQHSSNLERLNLFCKHKQLDVLPSNIKTLKVFNSKCICNNSLIHLDQLFVCYLYNNIDNLYNISKFVIQHYLSRSDQNLLDLLLNSDVGLFFFSVKSLRNIEEFVEQIGDKFGSVKLMDENHIYANNKLKFYRAENSKFALVKPAK